LFAFFAVLFVVQLPWQAMADVIDAPHNQASGISCQNCHTYSLWWQFSPVNTAPNRASLVEALCASCHAGTGTGPHVATHSSAALGTVHRAGLGEWSRSCLDCHDPHFQQQLRGWATDSTVPDTDLYLVQGTINAITNNGTHITYTLNQAKTKSAWANPADWNNNSSSRSPCQPSADKGLGTTVS